MSLFPAVWITVFKLSGEKRQISDILLVKRKFMKYLSYSYPNRIEPMAFFIERYVGFRPRTVVYFISALLKSTTPIKH